MRATEPDPTETQGGTGCPRAASLSFLGFYLREVLFYKETNATLTVTNAVCLSVHTAAPHVCV